MACGEIQGQVTALQQGRGRDPRGLRRIRIPKLRITTKKARFNRGEREGTESSYSSMSRVKISEGWLLFRTPWSCHTKSIAVAQ